MPRSKQIDTVTFTVKGQVVIPAKLRRELNIAAGTRAVVEKTTEGILLRPLVEDAIEHMYGAFAQASDQDFRTGWAEYKRQERSLEERRISRLRSR